MEQFGLSVCEHGNPMYGVPNILCSLCHNDDLQKQIDALTKERDRAIKLITCCKNFLDDLESVNVEGFVALNPLKAEVDSFLLNLAPAPNVGGKT